MKLAITPLAPRVIAQHVLMSEVGGDLLKSLIQFIGGLWNVDRAACLT